MDRAPIDAAQFLGCKPLAKNAAAEIDAGIEVVGNQGPVMVWRRCLQRSKTV